MNECSICLEKVEENNEKYVTKCNHIFHEKCYLKWLEYKKICPLCRTEIIEIKSEDVEVNIDIISEEEQEEIVNKCACYSTFLCLIYIIFNILLFIFLIFIFLMFCQNNCISCTVFSIITAVFNYLVILYFFYTFREFCFINIQLGCVIFVDSILIGILIGIQEMCFNDWPDPGMKTCECVYNIIPTLTILLVSCPISCLCCRCQEEIEEYYD